MQSSKREIIPLMLAVALITVVILSSIFSGNAYKPTKETSEKNIDYSNGLIVVNSEKAIYKPGEKALIKIAVLDKEGYPANADVKLSIRNPQNQIAKPIIEKVKKGIYQTSYETTIEGIYETVAQAKNNELSIATKNVFKVSNDYPFDIIRQTPISINPWDGPFTTSIKIEPLIDVESYTFKEFLPKEFEIISSDSDEILNEDGLTVSWKKLSDNEELTYKAQAPLVTPDKAKIISEIEYDNQTFREARPWQMAIDALCWGDEYDFASNSNNINQISGHKCKPCASETVTDPTATETSGLGELNDFDFETGGSIGKLKVKWKGTGDYEYLRVDTAIPEGLRILNNNITLRIVGTDFKEDKTQCGGKQTFSSADSINAYVYDTATTVDALATKTFSTGFYFQEPGACTSSPTNCNLDSINLSIGDLYQYTPAAMNFTIRLVIKDTATNNMDIGTMSEAYVQYQIDYPANITSNVSVSNSTLEEGMTNNFSATCSEPNGQTFQLIVCDSAATFCNTSTLSSNIICSDSLSTQTSRSCLLITNSSYVGTHSGDYAVCCDEGGYCDATNESVDTWTVLASTVPAVVSLNYPGDAATIEDMPLDFNFTATDNYGLANCSLWSDYGGWSLKSTVYSPQNNTNTNITINLISAGNYVWNVQCYDLVDNSNWYTSNYSFTVIEIPVINLESPPQPFSTTDTNITFNYNVSGTSALINCSLYIDNLLNQTNTSPQLGQTESFYLNFSSEGSYSWKVGCTNDVGGTGTSSSRTVNIDNSAPSSVINEPSNSSYTTATPEINFTLTDSVDTVLNYTIFVDGSANGQNGTANNGTKTTLTINPALSEGIHTIIVEATDDVGFKTNSTTITLIVDATNPAINLIYPGSAETVYSSDVIFKFTMNSGYTQNGTCNLIIDGTINQSGIAAANGTSVQWPVYNFPESTYSWSVNCTEDSGNNNVSETRTFTIDLTPQGLGFGEDIPVPANGYSEATELFRMCTDAECSSAGTNFVTTDTVYMQMLGPNDLGTGNKNKFYVYNGSSINILRTGSWTCGGGGGSDGTWNECNVSFPVGGLNDGWYFIESDIEDAAKTQKHREFTTFTVSSTQPVSGLWYKFYNDASYTREDDTFFNGDEVYVEIFALPNLTMNTAKTKPTLTDFHKSKIKDFSALTTYDSLVSPYRFHFTMTNDPTAGYWYFLEVKLEEAGGTKIGPGKQGRMMIYETNYQPNVTDTTAEPNPVDEESNVTFTITYDDDNIANRHIARVCTTNSLTGTTCTASELCSSTDYLLSTSSNNPRSCQYTAQRTDSENNTAYAFVCDNKDSCSLGLAVEWNVTKDHVKPTITLNNPENNNWFNTNNLTLNYTPFDASGIANCTLYIDSALNQTNTTITNNSINNFFTILSEGSHTWQVNCTDNSSMYNMNISETRTFYIDITNPSSTINEPFNDSYSSDVTPEVNFTLVDNLDSLLNYTVFVDGSANGQSGTSSNNSKTSLNISTLSQGLHTIIVEATDEALNKDNSTSLTITIDTTSPTTTLYGPTQYLNTSSANVLFNYTFYDGLSPNASCSMYLDNSLNRTDTLQNSTVFNFTYVMSQGNHYWNLTCTDLAGNSDWSENRQFTIDLTSPTIKLEYPANDTLNETSNNIGFGYNVTDSITGVTDCSLVINGSVSPPTDTNIQEGQSQTFQRALSNGAYLWWINCTDTVGRTNISEKRTLTVNVTIDNDPPTITLNNPQNDYFSSINNITFYFTPTDALSNISNCSLYLNNQLNFTKTNITNSAENNITVNNFVDNSYLWYVNCTDTSGNEGQSTETRNLTIDTTSPDNFVLSYPVNNTFSTDITPFVNWSNTTEINLKNYTLMFDNDSSFSSPEHLFYTYLVNDSLYQVVGGDPLTDDSSFYWRVIAYDKAGNSRISNQTYIYTTDNTQPTSFSLFSPDNNTYSEDRTPLLTWTSSSDTNFANYTIEVSDDISFTYHNFTYYTYQYDNVTFQVISDWADNSIFYWRVRSYDNANNTRQTGIFTYTIDNINLTAFNLTSPSDGTINQSLSPTVTWQQSNDTNFDNYTVQFSDTNNFSYLNFTYNSFNSSNTSLTASGLTDNALFYWQVIAYDKAGHSTNSTSIFTYKTDNTVPVVRLELPVNNTESGQSLINFYYNVTDTNNITSCSLIVDETVEDTETIITKSITQTLTAVLSNGQHNWSVNCTDKAENTGASEQRNITVNVVIPTHRYNETSTASCTGTLCSISLGATDGTENQVSYDILGPNLVQIVNATSTSLGANGLYIPSAASVSFTGEFWSNKDRTFITWFLDYYNGTDYTRICQAGLNESGGTLITPKNQDVTKSDSCSVSSALRLFSTDNLRLGINLFNSDSGKTNQHRHYWDNTRTSYVDLEAYILGFLDVNISSPLIDPQPAENTDFNVACNVSCPQGICMNTTLTIQYNSSSLIWTDISSSGNIKLASGETNDRSLGDINSSVQTINFSLTANTPSVNNIRCIAISDYSNANGSLTTQVTVRDVTKPGITLGSPVNDTWNNQANITFFFTPSDNVNLSNCTLIMNEQIVANSTVIQNNIENNISTIVSDGIYNWSVNCTDTSGNENSSSTIKIIKVDATLPNSTINEPVDYSYSSDVTPEVNFTLVDNLDSLLNYTVFVDGSANGQSGTSSNNSKTSLNISTLSQGLHTIIVEATDEALNKDNSTSLTITIDTTSPTINTYYPPSNLQTPNSSLMFNYSYTDALSPNATCNLYINSTLNRTDTAYNNTPLNFSLTFDQGYYNWYINCTDLAGNLQKSTTENLTIDLTSPTLNLISPDNGNYSNETSTIVFFFNTTDLITDVVECYLTINSTLSEPNETTIVEGETTNFTRAITNGNHSWNISCTDTVGRTNTSETRILIVNVTIDLDPPEILLSYPVSNEYVNTSNITFLYTPTDALSAISNCSIYINDTFYNRSTNITNGEQNNFTITNLTDGGYNWYMNCSDSAGNNGTSATENYVKDTVFPAIFNLLAPANNTYSTSLIPLINWTNTTELNFDNYTLQFDDNADFSSPEHSYYSYLVNDSLYQVVGGDPLTDDSSFYWRVIAYDKAGNSRISNQTYIYTTDNTQPTSFDLVSPSNDTVSTDLTPAISWQQTTETNFDNYTIQFSDTASFSYVNFTFNTYQSNNNSLTTTSLTDNALFYWRVIAYDKTGLSRNSTSTYIYITDNINPSAFNLSSPSNNTYSSDRTPLLTWQQSADTNFANYTIQISDTSSFTYANYTYNTYNSTNNSHQVTSNWTDNTIFYWRATAYDRTGSSYTTAHYIYTLDTIKPIVSLESPVNGYNSTESVVTFYYNVTDFNDILNCSLLINNEVKDSNSVITKDITQQLSATITNGAQNWSINCTDQAANVGNSTTRIVNQNVSIPVMRWNETATQDYTSTANINLGTKDILENKITKSIGATSLYTMASATSSSMGSNGIVIMPSSIISMSGVFQSTFANDGYITWKLYNNNGTDNLICQSGDDNIGGTKITVTSKQTYANTCNSPASQYRLKSGDTLKLEVNIYNDRAASQSFKHYWDANSESYTQFNAYTLGFLNSTKNLPLSAEERNQTEVFTVSCNTTCEGGNCLATKVYVQLNTTGSDWSDISTTGNIILNGSETNGKSIGTTSSTVSQTNFTLKGNLPSTNMVRCRSTSDYDNDNSSATQITILDTTPPVISLSSPVAGFNTTNTSLNFTWTPTDNFYNNISCDITVNNQTTSNLTTTNATALTQEFTNIQSGYAYWNVTCKDERNNTKISATRNFTIVKAPSKINITINSDNSSLDLAWPSVQGALSYSIYITNNYDSGFPVSPDYSGITDTNWTDTSPGSSSEKYYKISAVRGGAEDQTVKTVGKQEKALKGTWVLVSFPFNLTSSRLGNKSVFGDPIVTSPPGAIISIYRYETSGPSWEKVDYYDWGWKQATGSEDFLTIDAGRGYWFEMSGNATAYQLGEMIEQNLTVSVKQDWNIVGWPYRKSVALPTGGEPPATPLTVNPLNSITRLYNYNSTGEIFKKTDHFADWGWWPAGNSPEFTSLESGRGYYLKASQNATWTLELS